MGVKWLKEQVEKAEPVLSTSFPGERCLLITYRLNSGRIVEEKVYMPTGQEYLIGDDVIDRVADLGVTLIVPSHFSEVTAHAKTYAKMKNMRVLDSARQFLAILHDGEAY